MYHLVGSFRNCHFLSARFLTPTPLQCQCQTFFYGLVYFAEGQCYGQFGELRDWWPKLLSSVRRTEFKESEFTKSSLAIWNAANWATKIGSAKLLFMAKRYKCLPGNVIVITPYCTFHECLSSEVSFERWKQLTFCNSKTDWLITSTYLHTKSANWALDCHGIRNFR